MSYLLKSLELNNHHVVKELLLGDYESSNDDLIKSLVYIIKNCKDSYLDIVQILFDKGVATYLKQEEKKNIFEENAFNCYLKSPNIFILLIERLINTDVKEDSQIIYNIWFLLFSENSQILSKDIIEILLKKIDVNVLTEEDGSVALMYACSEKKKDIIQILLNLGADVNIQNANHDTSLMFACQQIQGKPFVENLEIVEMLLEGCADVNIRNKKNTTALFDSCGSKDTNIEIIEMLLEKDADVNIIADDSNEFPLGLACSNGRDDICEILLKKGANVNLKNINGLYPLIVAYDGYEYEYEDEGKDALNYLRIVEMLIEIKDIDLTVKDVKTGRNALIYASRNGNTEILKKLLQKDQCKNEINIKDNKAKTAFDYACEFGHVDVIKILLDCCNELKINEVEINPLILSCTRKKTDVVEMLLTSTSINVNVKNRIGDTPLIHSIKMIARQTDENERQKLIKIIEMLLKKEEIDLNISNMNGERALYLAVFANERKLVKMLIEKGAKIADDVNPKTAINKYVPIFQNPDIPYKIKILFSDYFKKYIEAVFYKKYDEKDNKKIHEIFNRFIEGDKTKIVYEQIIHSTINDSFDPNYLPEGETNTILMSTIKSKLDMYNISRVVSLLLEKGANVNTQNENGYTALMLACDNENIDLDIIEMLLEKGADLNIRDSKGRTALMLACTTGYSSLVEILLKRGSNVNITNSSGSTALMFACLKDGKDRNKIIKMLLNKDADVNIINRNGDTALNLLYGENENMVDENIIIDILDKIDQNLMCVDKLDNIEKKIIDLRNRKTGLSPLIFECSNKKEEGRLNIINKLLEKGADVEIKSSDNETLLFFPLRNPNPELNQHNIIEILLGKGLDINHKNKNGETILMIASAYGFKNVVEMLLKYEADVNLKNQDDNTALNVASAQGNTEIVPMLLKRKLDDIDNMSKTNTFFPLYFTCWMGYVEIVKMLLENGANPNKTAEEGNTPLIKTCSSEYENNVDVPIVQMLLFGNVDVNIRNEKGHSAFFYTCNQGKNEILKNLFMSENLKRDESFNNEMIDILFDRDITQEIVQIILFYHGHYINKNDDIIDKINSITDEKKKKLLNECIGKNIQENSTYYLNLAFENQWLEIISLFVMGKPADLNGMDYNIFFDDKGRINVLSYISYISSIHINIKDDKNYYKNIYSILFDNFKKFKNSQFVMNFFIIDDFTFLANCLSKDIIEITISKLNKDEWVNIKDENGQTCLMNASDNGNDELVGYLLKNGVNINEVDNDQQNAFQYSYDFNDLVYPDKIFKVIKVLMNYGGNVDVKIDFLNLNSLESKILNNLEALIISPNDDYKYKLEKLEKLVLFIKDLKTLEELFLIKKKNDIEVIRKLWNECLNNFAEISFWVVVKKILKHFINNTLVVDDNFVLKYYTSNDFMNAISNDKNISSDIFKRLLIYSTTNPKINAYEIKQQLKLSSEDFFRIIIEENMIEQFIFHLENNTGIGSSFLKELKDGEVDEISKRIEDFSEFPNDIINIFFSKTEDSKSLIKMLDKVSDGDSIKYKLLSLLKKRGGDRGDDYDKNKINDDINLLGNFLFENNKSILNNLIFELDFDLFKILLNILESYDLKKYVEDLLYDDSTNSKKCNYFDEKKKNMIADKNYYENKNILQNLVREIRKQPRGKIKNKEMIVDNLMQYKNKMEESHKSLDIEKRRVEVENIISNIFKKLDLPEFYNNENYKDLLKICLTNYELVDPRQVRKKYEKRLDDLISFIQTKTKFSFNKTIFKFDGDGFEFVGDALLEIIIDRQYDDNEFLKIIMKDSSLETIIKVGVNKRKQYEKTNIFLDILMVAKDIKDEIQKLNNLYVTIIPNGGSVYKMNKSAKDEEFNTDFWSADFLEGIIFTLFLYDIEKTFDQQLDVIFEWWSKTFNSESELMDIISKFQSEIVSLFTQLPSKSPPNRKSDGAFIEEYVSDGRNENDVIFENISSDDD